MRPGRLPESIEAIPTGARYRPADLERDSLNMRMAGRWPYTDDCYTVAVDEVREIAFLGAGGGIYLLDVSDPSSPMKLGQIATPGQVMGLFYLDGLLYVADGREGLRVISAANPAYPVEIGSCDTPGMAMGVMVSGSYAYVADMEGGLRVISVSDPTNPAEEGSYVNDHVNLAKDVDVEGSYAYVTGGGGFTVISLSDPGDPVEVGFHYLPGLRLDVSGSCAYVAINGALAVISIEDPTDPEELGRCDDIFGVDVAVQDSFAYVAGLLDGMGVVSISDPANPVLVGIRYMSWAEAVAIEGSHVNVACDSYGLVLTTVEDPVNPVITGTFDEVPGWTQKLEANGPYVYIVSGQKGVWAVSVQDPARPIEIGRFDLPDYLNADATDIALNGPFAYVPYTSEWDSWLVVLSIEDPYNLAQVGSFFPNPAYGMWYPFAMDIEDPYAYVAAGTWGLRVLSLEDPANPVEVGNYEPSYGCYIEPAVEGNYAYVPYNGRLMVLSVDDPANPVEVGSYEPEGEHPSVGTPAIHGPYSYLVTVPNFLDDDSYLDILSLEDPANPVEVDSCTPPDEPSALRIAGSLLFVMDRYFGLRVFSIADPENPVEVGFYELPWSLSYNMYDFEVDGPYIYLANGPYGMTILEYSGPTAVGDGSQGADPLIPRAFSLSQNYPNPFNPYTIIKYQVPERSGVTIRVYDLRGHLVRTLVDQVKDAGTYLVQWNGRMSSGQTVPSGIYFYTMKTDKEFRSIKKMVILK
jgi:hypothetical protein